MSNANRVLAATATASLAVAAAIVLGAAGTGQQPGPKGWDYKVIDLDPAADKAQVVLADWGKKGWELVSVAAAPAYELTPVYTLTLNRLQMQADERNGKYNPYGSGTLPAVLPMSATIRAGEMHARAFLRHPA
jgi:hypothetical protein